MDWTTPGIEEVAPGVHRIPLPMPTDGLRAVNVYAVLGTGSNTLIDGGWKIEPAVVALDEALATLDLSAGDFAQCLVTHHHRDHYTLAVELRRRVGMTISLGEGERDNMDAAYAVRPVAFQSQLKSLADAGAQSVLDMVRAVKHEGVDRHDYEPPDAWLADADRLDASGRTLRVVATPGHTSGHVVFVDDDAGLMFSGDHVLPHITPSVGLQAVPAVSPLADFLSSLARVVSEPDRIMLPAHGPAGGSIHERATQLIAHHETRLTDTAAALTGGAATAYEVARHLRWTSRSRHLDEMDALNQMLAVMETVAHLDVLRAQGRVTRTEQAGDPWVYAV
ncbi:MBL fold metallo-hydrolase [Lapillicoccus sp.]|uniref:MBL fold metallo-hydrolase n=1 Tax=Lapillicoccus sp. TaxID=1909287 RepID=UPI0025D928D5|nr:MBL fold metallo-hydrolase [Lapillicoccus sp.]